MGHRIKTEDRSVREKVTGRSKPHMRHNIGCQSLFTPTNRINMHSLFTPTIKVNGGMHVPRASCPGPARRHVLRPRDGEEKSLTSATGNELSPRRRGGKK